MKKALSIITVLALLVGILTGCKIQIGTTTNESGEHEIQRLLLTVQYAEDPVYVYIEDAEQFEGLKDMIQGSDTFGMEDRIIEEVLSCSDFGYHYSGNYVVSGSHLEEATICFSRGTQELDTMTLGVNYYDLIMQATAIEAEEVHIRYGEKITQTKVVGDFSFFAFTLSEDSPMQFGSKMLTVTGSTESAAEISLNWDGETFTVVSDQPLSGITISAEFPEQEDAQTLELAASAYSYFFTTADGTIAGEAVTE